MMKPIHFLTIVVVFLSVSVATASDWNKQIRQLAPASVTLINIEEADGYLTIEGEADSNADISTLMRAIDRANLGTPELEKVSRSGNSSRFTLRVKLLNQ